MSVIQKLTNLGIINPPKFLPTNIHYETLMGSVAYGVSSDTSDSDVYGFCIPPKETIFPHLAGEIEGFGTQKKKFNQYQEHHVKHEKKEYDFSIYNIVNFFNLLMQNNPNIIDSIFTPANCVLHMTQIGQMVRENRTMFLHKGSFHKFKGYAYSQLSKIESKHKATSGKRKQLIEDFGYDVKYAYHVVRLADECQQILEYGDLNLQRNKEQLKAIRKGEMAEDEIRSWFTAKEKHLEKLYETSNLPEYPNEQAIKQLLLQCLEHHYGSLDKIIYNPDKYQVALEKIKDICYSIE